MLLLKILVPAQRMQVFNEEKQITDYAISTARNGVGEDYGSEKTPRGWHMIRAKIGHEAPINTVFIRRRPTGEIYTPELRVSNPNRDWILTRIFWLSGLEVGKNRLGPVDTMRRYVYIHGAPEEAQMGIPGSRGCIRMKNQDLIELFNLTPVGTRVFIQE